MGEETMFDLTGRNALVTGAGGGLGSAIASCLAAQGASVAVTDLLEAAAETTASDLSSRFPNQRFRAIKLDVTDEDNVRAAYVQAAAEVGDIDVLVNVAGIATIVRFEEMTFSEWREMLGIHLDGTFLCTRYALPGMLERGFGRVICISSIVSTTGVAYETHYGAAKGGIDGLVRSLSREVASRGVTVNAIRPGYFDTPLSAMIPAEELRLLQECIAVGRFGRPEEVGALAVYLASDEAEYMTGELISPNGGFSYGHADLDALS